MINIPSDLIDQDYKYYYNESGYLIVTDSNCTATQCDCILVQDGVGSEPRQCDIAQDLYQINYNNITAKPVGVNAILVVILGVLVAVMFLNMK